MWVDMLVCALYLVVCNRATARKGNGMRDGTTTYSQTIDHLEVFVGKGGCEQGEVEIVFDIDVEVIIDVYVEHDGNYTSYSDTEITDIRITKVHSIHICGNDLPESTHTGMQMWLERDFKSEPKSDSYMMTSVEEHGIDASEMNAEEPDHEDI